MVGSAQRLGLSPTNAPRLVNLAALLATLCLTMALCARLGGRSRAFGLGVAVLVLLGPSISPVFGGPGQTVTDGLSEGLFIPLVLAALLAYGLTAVKPSLKADGLAVVLTVMVVMTRWAGMGIGFVGAITILVGSATSLKNRLVRACVVLAAAPFATLVWSALSNRLYGAGAARALVWHPKSDHLISISRVVTGWFFLPRTLPAPVAIGFTLVVILGPPLLVLIWRDLFPSGSWPLALALALFPPVYLLNTVAAQTLFDAAIPLDQRILIVIQPVTYVILCSLGYHLVGRITSTYPAARRAPARPAIVVSTALLLVTMLVVLSLNFADQSRRSRHGIELQAELRQTSVLHGIPNDYLVFANNPSGVWIYGARGAYMVPQRSLSPLTR